MYMQNQIDLKCFTFTERGCTIKIIIHSCIQW